MNVLFELFEVAAVDRDVLGGALALDFDDYEDAVLHEAARSVAADAIVTRDRGDFTNATLPVLNPIELLAVMASRQARRRSSADFLTDCVMVFDAETGVLKTQEGRVVTATPPSGATP